MRMRRRNNLAPRMERCTELLVAEPLTMAGKWRQLMPDCKELRVEVGCGKGKFTVETAQQEPDVLIIAIEKVKEAMILAMERAQEMQLKNVFFVDMDVCQIARCFEPGEIDLLYINFCDPWPRGKHAKRRLTYHSFLDQYALALSDTGRIAFKTDNADLFEWSLEEMTACGWELRDVTRDLHKDGIVGVMTGYEEKFHALGTPINRCEAFKTAETHVIDPADLEKEAQNPMQ